MKRLALVFAALWTTLLIPMSATSEELLSKPQQLACDIGPVVKTYGMTQWFVYSCDDNRTAVIVSAPGNPAMPFYFTLTPRENGYQLSGEGTGRKDATAAAFDEIKALSAREIVALIEETKTR